MTVEEAQTKETQIVKCSNCRRNYQIDDETLVERPLEQYPAIKDYILVCPHCGFELHTHYETPTTAASRAALRKAARRIQEGDGDKQRGWKRYQHAKRKHERTFDREQKRVKQLLGEAAAAVPTPPADLEAWKVKRDKLAPGEGDDGDGTGR